MSGEDRSFIVTGDEDEFERRMEQGVYPVTTTSGDRYTNPDSYAYRMLEDLSDFLDEYSGESEIYVLDIGSSSGEALEGLLEELEEDVEPDVHGLAVDVDRGMMERCSSETGNTALQARAQALPLAENSVDVVVSNQLNLRDEEIETVVKEINRILKDEGMASLVDGYQLEDVDYSGRHKGEVRGERGSRSEF